MTVSISRMNIEYYLSSTAQGDGQFTEVKDLTSYYLEIGAPAGRWFGSGLAGISMSEGELVEKRHARKLFDELLDPITGEPLGRRPIRTQQTPVGATTPKGNLARSKREAVAGFDLTFSVPKSVSVLWALADPATQGRLYAAHHEAIRQTFQWLEAEVVQARSGHGGVAHVDVKGLIGTAFDHWESRAGDPQLHTHAVIANRVQRVEDGQWVTLDSYTLHRHVVAASEMYNGLLFDEVQRRTGAVAEQRGKEVIVNLPNEKERKKGFRVLDVDEKAEGRSRVELAGIPDELIHEFSTRSIAVETEKDRLILAFQEKYGREPDNEEIIKLREQATLATRTAKPKESLSLNKQMFDWQNRARNEGFNVEKIVRKTLAGEDVVIEAHTLPQSIIDSIANYVLEDVATSRPSFTKANLLAATNRLLMTVRCQSPQTRQDLINRITDTAITQAVQLSPNRMGAPVETTSNLVRNGHSIFDQPESWLYSTQTLLDQETHMRAAATQEAGPYLQDSEATQEHLANVEVGDGHKLASDQAAAAHQVLTSHHQVTAIIGPAGTGKTTTMRGIHSAWTESFGPGSVVGLAPSAVAASVLSEEVGMPTENVAKWLYESVGQGSVDRIARYQEAEEKLAALHQRQLENPSSRALAKSIENTHARITKLLAEQAKFSLRPNQLLIIDEASMAATGDLAQLTAQVQAAGAKLLLVGDPAQLEAVEAGGFLGWMERSNKSASLNSVWRFKNDWEAAASLQLREGDPEVINVYRENGRITDCEPGTANEAAYMAWLETTTGKEAEEAILIGADNKSVLDLNTRAQEDLLTLGHITKTRKPAKLRSNEAHVGDLILARKNDRKVKDDNNQFIKNGTRIKVTKIQRDGSIIGMRTDTNQRIVIPPEYLKHNAELGYAVTAHRSQGVTVDKAYCAVKEGLGRELLYVGMTRGKHLNQLFVEIPETAETHAPDAWDMYKIETTVTADDVLHRILANSTAVTLATEDRDAAYGAANDLTRLVSEYEHLQVAINTRQANTWITETYGAETLRDFQRNPDWRKLITQWKPCTHPDNSLPPRFPEILDALKNHPQKEQNFVEHLVPKANPETPEEQRIAKLLEQQISNRLDYLEYETQSENPAWLRELTPEEESPSKAAVRATLLWRELADQQELTYNATEPSNNHKRLTPQWNRLQTLIGAVPGKPQTAESGQEPIWTESDFDDDPETDFTDDWLDGWQASSPSEHSEFSTDYESFGHEMS